MATLSQIETWLPERSVRVADLQEHLELSNAQVKVFTRIHGLDTVRLDPDASVIDGLIEAAAPIVRSVGDSGRIRYLLHAHTLQEVAPSTVNVIHEVRERLGLHEAMAFSITQQNCASGLLAIDIADKLLEAAGDDDGLALVLMGEKPYTPSAQLIDNTTIMGEAAAACLVAPGGDRDRVLSYASQTLGEYSAGIALDAEALRSFEHRYTSTLAAVIERALERAGATLADATLVLPHNVNRSSWTRYARETGLPLERLFLDNVPRLGHCYCADPFLNLVAARDAGRLSRGDLYVMAAVGLGATFTAVVARH